MALESSGRTVVAQDYQSNWSWVRRYANEFNLRDPADPRDNGGSREALTNFRYNRRVVDGWRGARTRYQNEREEDKQYVAHAFALLVDAYFPERSLLN